MYKRQEEIEIVTGTEMEQQAGDKEEAGGRVNWEKLMELMSGMKEDNKRMEEQNRQINEKLDSINEDIVR